MKPKYHQDCTILRTKEVTHYTLNIVTGESKDSNTETVTEPCGTPLFSDSERADGICRSCRDGWEVEGNTFANEEEKARATKKQ